MAVGLLFSCDRSGAEAGRVRLYAPGEAVPARDGDEVEQFDEPVR